MFSLAPKEKNMATKEEKLKVEGERVSPRVIKQVSGRERLKNMGERWVYIYPVWSRDHVTRPSMSSCSQMENPARLGDLEFLFV